jgi:hypothetical protein
MGSVLFHSGLLLCVIVLIALFESIVVAETSNDVFKELETILLSMKGDTSPENSFLEKISAIGEDTLKEVEIFCPGPESPVVSIRDIAEDGGGGGTRKTCTTLKLTGANFHLKLDIHCGEDDF